MRRHARKGLKTVTGPRAASASRSKSVGLSALLALFSRRGFDQFDAIHIHQLFDLAHEGRRGTLRFYR